MGDYMQALQQRFDTQRQETLTTLSKEFASAVEELRGKLDRPERKLLLRVVDTATALRAEQALVSFTAGFKVAHGIAEELEPRYSFAKEEEEQARRRARDQGVDNAADDMPNQ